MRLTLIAAACALAPTIASAQTCYSYGNVLQCSDGTTGYRYGNGSLYSDGTTGRRRNDTPMYPDLGASYSGNVTVFNDGRSAYSYGNTTVTIDARTCYRHGDALICRHVPKGLAPSATPGAHLAPSAVGAPHAVRIDKRRSVPKPAPATREARRPAAPDDTLSLPSRTIRTQRGN